MSDSCEPIGNVSVLDWTKDNELDSSFEKLAIGENDDVREGPGSPERHIISEDTPEHPPESESECTVTSVDEALRAIQGVILRTHSDPYVVVDEISDWAARCSSSDLETFRDNCKVYAHDAWIKVSSPSLSRQSLAHSKKTPLPQADAKKMNSVLPSIERDANPGSEGREYLNLKAAHMLAVTWAGLYVRGIFTYQFFGESIMMLWEYQDYVRCDLITTLLAMASVEVEDANTDFVDAEELDELLVMMREATTWHHDHMS